MFPESFNGNVMTTVQTSTVSEYHEPYYYVVHSVLYTLSVLLNSVVVFVILRSERLRTPTNFLIASLATTDTIYAVGEAGYAIETLLIMNTGRAFMPNSRAWLSFVSSMYVCGKMSNYFHLMSIAFERWVYIVRPFLHERLVGNKRICLILVIIWLFSFFAGLDILIKQQVVNSVKDAPVRFALVYPIVHFLCSAVICTVYVHIAIISHRHMQAIQAQELSFLAAANERHRLRSLKSNWKIVRMVITVFGMFFLTVTPVVCLHAYLVHSNTSMTNMARQILPLLAATHYCSNFFVFFSQCKMFRDMLFFCKSKVKVGALGGNNVSVNTLS
ncbi:adenosine receptor A2b [Aplysia californica]|uniref:Adenosine receptor A2b n=1 Tax=Aplysia californica TaxID=6500 RepID=A0ABM0JZI8_APLCA|nr:adenosine receptor A2b [Aplysia californica]